jgi:hypothetical protein
MRELLGNSNHRGHSGLHGNGHGGKKQVVVRYGTTCRRPAFGDGSEAQHLESVIDSVEERFREIDPETEIFEEVVVTADSGFNNEEAMKVLQDRSIDAFVADPQFRSS